MTPELLELRDGTRTDDPRLDRLVQFDERSRNFPVSAVVPSDLRSRSWRCSAFLDQGREGACVGFAWAHELAAEPTVVKAHDSFAQAVYRQAQRIDEWPGENYSGTSVLAGAKVVQNLGAIKEYRWAFSIEDVVRAIVHAGPVVFGLPWLDTMFDPRPSGLLDCSGKVAGGHAICGRGVQLKPRLRGERVLEPVVRLRNSWGNGWGIDGDCFLKLSDLEKLLHQRGETCVPIGRARVSVL